MTRLGLALAALCCLGVAEASVFDTYGFGARAAAMANAHVAAADDYSAVYYNPGALTVHKAPQTAVGAHLILPGLSTSGGDRADPEAVVPQTNVGIQLGLLFPLGGLVQNRFALGVGIYLPTIQVTRVESFDPTTPNFYRYGALPDKINLALGAAFELHETISVGIGYQYLGLLDGDARVDVDLLTRRFTRKDIGVDIEGRGGLTAGLHVRPTRRLAIGVSYREALSIEYDLLVDIRIQQVGALQALIDGIALYTPAQYTLGVAWRGEGWAVTGDLVWARWSEAPDPAPGLKITLDGAPLGLDAIEADAGPIDLGAQDTLSPRLGAEWSRLDPVQLRGGLAMRPTPLPAQTGYANYLDSDAWIIGAGLGYRFKDPLEVHEAPITLDLTAQLTVLSERTHQKTSDLGGATRVAGGRIWHTAFTFRHDF